MFKPDWEGGSLHMKSPGECCGEDTLARRQNLSRRLQSCVCLNSMPCWATHKVADLGQITLLSESWFFKVTWGYQSNLRGWLHRYTSLGALHGMFSIRYGQLIKIDDRQVGTQIINNNPGETQEKGAEDQVTKDQNTHMQGTYTGTHTPTYLCMHTHAHTSIVCAQAPETCTQHTHSHVQPCSDFPNL